LAKQQQEPAPAICWITVAKISAYRINEPFIPLKLFKNDEAIKSASREIPARCLAAPPGS